ncbi:phosphoglycolate phosphatase [Pacificimonas flava]|uniref:Phosphoglycolate phosphatase n=2 Tax=Pacificimonas TaxID=1960290 RepID=A0A219B882_9SPHN|nr:MULTISPECIES: HAD hydrolase-like protein [Pacificimonas]MBZ6378780.1 HAD hydrolase-like protein [Pacificimonas aurantium]OWV33958.1 phosphoglycolate phosphatase [Pacificimonas flava]
MPETPRPSVCFDLDGTLVDTAPDLAAAMNAVLDHFGRPHVETDRVRDMVGHGARRTIEKGLALTGGGSERMLDEGVPVFLDHYARNICVGSRPWPGVEAALDALAEDALLSVCTNKPAALARDLIQALGWAPRFAAILGADSLDVKKPDPRHLTETIVGAGGDPRRAVYVGDSSVDSRAAAAARIPFILFRPGYLDCPAEELETAAVIDRFDELRPALHVAAPSIWSTSGAPT